MFIGPIVAICLKTPPNWGLGAVGAGVGAGADGVGAGAGVGAGSVLAQPIMVIMHNTSITNAMNSLFMYNLPKVH
jgi:hypothetical protein